jgi:hypothetical protein
MPLWGAKANDPQHPRECERSLPRGPTTKGGKGSFLRWRAGWLASWLTSGLAGWQLAGWLAGQLFGQVLRISCTPGHTLNLTFPHSLIIVALFSWILFLYFAANAFFVPVTASYKVCSREAETAGCTDRVGLCFTQGRRIAQHLQALL